MPPLGATLCRHQRWAKAGYPESHPREGVLGKFELAEIPAFFGNFEAMALFRSTQRRLD